MPSFYKLGLQMDTFELPSKVRAYADRAQSIVETVKDGSIDFYHGSRRFYNHVTKGSSESGIPKVVNDAVSFVRMIGGIFSVKEEL